MGLSLRNLTHKIGDVLGGVERQVNPFDNGATYSNPQGNGQHLSVIQQVTRPAVNVARTVENSPLGSGIRIGLADITNNPVARYNAATSFNQAQARLGQTLTNPSTYLAFTGEGGPEEFKPTEIPKPKVTLNGKDITPPLVGKNVGKVPSEEEFNKIIPAVKGIKQNVSPKLTAEDLANLPAKQQMRIYEKTHTPPTPGTGLNAEKNPLFGQVDVPQVQPGDVAQPHLNAAAVLSHERTVGQQALDALHSLSAKDQQLMKSIETKPVNVVARQADNPKAFKAAEASIRNYYNLRHAYDQRFGIKTNYRQNYLRQILESQPVSGDVYKASGGNLTPGYTLERTNDTLNTDVGTALERDILGASYNHAKLAYEEGLQQAFPDAISKGEILKGPQGTFQQLKTPFGKELSASPEVAKQINLRAPVEQSGGAVGAYDRANAFLKFVKLGGGTFHAFTEAGNFLGQQLASLRLFTNPSDSGRFMKAIFHPGTIRAAERDWAATGMDQKFRVSGLTTMAKDVKGDVSTNPTNIIGKATGIKAIHDATFHREIPFAKKVIFAQKARNLDIKNPADVAKMRQIAEGLNNGFGGLNRAVHGLTPKTFSIAKRFLLATDFTEGKIRTILAAIAKGGPEGQLAREIVFGKAVLFAGLATGITAATGGLSNSDPKTVANDLLNNFIDPSINTGFKSAKGFAKVASFPATHVSEFGRVLKPVYQKYVEHKEVNPLSGVSQYATGRLAAVPSEVKQLVQNQDFYGNPIRIPGNNKQTALNVAGGALPIPGVQLQRAATKQEAPGEAILNTIGFRVHVDPNDPNYQAEQRYFDKRSAFINSLNQNDQNLFNKINPVKKDKYGNGIASKTVLTSVSNYGDLVANPSFTAKYQAYQQSQPSHDPLWDLQPDRLKAYMQAQIISKNDPGGDSTTVNALYKRLPSDFFAKRDQYFANLQAQGVKLSPSGFPPKPAMSQDLVSFSNSYYKLPYGTGARSAALRTPEGQKYIAYLNNNRMLNNKERAQLGLPPLEDPSTKYTSSSGSGKSYGYSGHKYVSRTKARLQNPTAYSVSISAGGKHKLSSVKSSKSKIKLAKLSPKSAIALKGKPKVSSTKSLV